AHEPICGSQSDTGSPLWPYCVHLRGEASNGEPISPIAVMTLPKLAGSGLPASLFSSGFGSNVSIWLGPPSMNMKMHAFALAGKCGFLGARGEPPASATGGSANSRLPCSKYVSASAPKPPPPRRRKSRRDGINSTCGTAGYRQDDIGGSSGGSR